MKRLALVVAVASFAAFAGEPTQSPSTTAPTTAPKKTLTPAGIKVINSTFGSGSLGSGSLGTRGSGSSTKPVTPAPTK